MKKQFFVLICLLLLTGCTTSYLTTQEKDKSTLDMQIKCNKAAKDYYKEVGGKDPYKIHYNSKLDKCFLHETHYPVGQGPYWEDIMDVLENKTYGHLLCSVPFNDKDDLSICFVEYGGPRIFCSSPDEFDNLIKPLMEE